MILQTIFQFILIPDDDRDVNNDHDDYDDDSDKHNNSGIGQC